MIKLTVYIIFLFIFFLTSLCLPAQQDSIDALKLAVAKTGKLKFKSDVPVKYFDKKALKNYITDLFQKEYPDALLEKEQLYLELMGFIHKKKINLKEERKQIFIENVGGLYNEKTGELYAIEEYRNIDYINALIVIHELRHAVQDQHFDLEKLLASRPASDFDDRRLSLLAAIEGDATFVMARFGEFEASTLTSTHGADALLSFSPTGIKSRLANTPGILKHQLIMPYIQGLNFVDYVHKRRRWHGVNKLLKNPPLSSEQVLHPAKYYKKELPVNVKIAYRPEGYSLYFSGVIGEYYLNVLLMPLNGYRDYALGWGGDRFEIYKNPSASYFLLWESFWDKEAFCTGFYQAFKTFVEKTFQVNFRESGKNSYDFIAGKTAVATPTYFFISKEKNRIFYVTSNDRNQVNKFINGGYYD